MRTDNKIALPSGAGLRRLRRAAISRSTAFLQISFPHFSGENRIIFKPGVHKWWLCPYHNYAMRCTAIDNVEIGGELNIAHVCASSQMQWERIEYCARLRVIRWRRADVRNILNVMHNFWIWCLVYHILNKASDRWVEGREGGWKGRDRKSVERRGGYLGRSCTRETAQISILAYHSELKVMR